jgi:hypothetical protein
MTSHVGRLYALALALLVFFLTWAAVAARPWVSTKQKADPRAAALAARERQLRHEAVVVQRVVARRWAVYRIALRQRRAAIAAARRAQLSAASPISAASTPSVRVVNLPPLTVTRTS